MHLKSYVGQLHQIHLNWAILLSEAVLMNSYNMFCGDKKVWKKNLVISFKISDIETTASIKE